MAPSFTGHFQVDLEAQFRLCENALRFAKLYLKPTGHFVVKILRGENQKEFHQALRSDFQNVQVMKPSASRKESTEIYFIAMNYKES